MMVVRSGYELYIQISITIYKSANVFGYPGPAAGLWLQI